MTYDPTDMVTHSEHDTEQAHTGASED